jgi:hypothetical protein
MNKGRYYKNKLRAAEMGFLRLKKEKTGEGKSR